MRLSMFLALSSESEVTDTTAKDASLPIAACDNTSYSSWASTWQHRYWTSAWSLVVVLVTDVLYYSYGRKGFWSGSIHLSSCWEVSLKCYSSVKYPGCWYKKDHIRFIRRERPRRVDASAQTRSSRELSRDSVYKAYFGARAIYCENWWGFKSRAWAFYSIGQGLASAIRAVGVFCGWNLVVECSQGRVLASFVPQGADNVQQCDFQKEHGSWTSTWFIRPWKSFEDT